MSISYILAHWPIALGYVAASAAVFWRLRRGGSTDRQAAAVVEPAEHAPAPATLVQAAASFFQLSCPLLLLTASLLAVAARLATGGWHWSDALVALAVVAFWPLQEWLIHVFILHLKPFAVLGRRIDPVLSRNHRNHHRVPWVPALGVTPAFIIWLYIAGLPVVWLLVLPPAQALTGMTLYFTLALYYEWVHYLIHTPYVPRTWLYRRLWRNHRLHHYQNEHYWFGVTMLSADRILRTQPSTLVAAHSPTCRTLGIDAAAESTDR